MSRVCQWHRQLTGRALAGLAQIPGLTIYGPRDPARRTSLVAFNLAGRDPVSVAEALDQAGVESRAGCHCATLAHHALGLDPPASCRLSFYLYNTPGEVDRAVAAVAAAAAGRRVSAAPWYRSRPRQPAGQPAGPGQGQSRRGETVQIGISCPGCGVPAEIADRFSLPSTDGPVEHVVVDCAAGHHYRQRTGCRPGQRRQAGHGRPPEGPGVVIIFSDLVRHLAFEFARGQHGHAAGTSSVAGASDQRRFPIPVGPSTMSQQPAPSRAAHSSCPGPRHLPSRKVRTGRPGCGCDPAGRRVAVVARHDRRAPARTGPADLSGDRGAGAGRGEGPPAQGPRLAVPR